MSDYSLELASERISDTRTRRYFSEVVTSYNSGCYRSAVVMLWSVVVCDVLFKLVQLAEQYGDSVAKSILKDVEVTRSKSPNSPEWEWYLVEQVKTRTQLLEAGDYANLEALQKHRHLSAHPVLSATEVLFEPNKETARAHIRNALEGVLTKPAIMTKKVFDAFVEDLESSSELLPDKASLIRYLSAKYFSHLTPIVEQAIFRSLWRLVFRSEDPRCEKNRGINFRALTILYERGKEQAKTAIGNERTHFSEVGLHGLRLSLLIRFLSTHPEVFPLLTEAAKTPLVSAANKSVSDFATATFLNPDMNTHLEAISKRIIEEKQNISGEAFEALLEVAREAGVEHKALDLAILQFGRSISFNMADGYFVSLINPFLDKFSKEQLVSLVSKANLNSQIYGRTRAPAQLKLIKDRIDTKFESDFDYARYPNFAGVIGIELELLPADDDDTQF